MLIFVLKNYESIKFERVMKVSDPRDVFYHLTQRSCPKRRVLGKCLFFKGSLISESFSFCLKSSKMGGSQRNSIIRQSLPNPTVSTFTTSRDKFSESRENVNHEIYSRITSHTAWI